MSCNKFIFWPGHCQHSEVGKVLNKLLVSPIKELALTLMTNKPMRKELLANNTSKYVIPARKPASKPASKPAPKTYPKAAPHVALQVILKVLEAKKAKVLRVILKASSRSAVLPRAKKPVKSLELAMVGAAFCQYLTKQKGVEIFGI